MSKVQIRPTAKTTATTITSTNVRSTGVLVELVDLSISRVVSFSSKYINQSINIRLFSDKESYPHLIKNRTTKNTKKDFSLDRENVQFHS